MIALASAVHDGLGYTETVTILGAIIAALFWKFLVKVGLALIAMGILLVIGTTLYLIVAGLQVLFR